MNQSQCKKFISKVCQDFFSYHFNNKPYHKAVVQIVCIEVRRVMGENQLKMHLLAMKWVRILLILWEEVLLA